MDVIRNMKGKKTNSVDNESAAGKIRVPITGDTEIASSSSRSLIFPDAGNGGKEEDSVTPAKKTKSAGLPSTITTNGNRKKRTIDDFEKSKPVQLELFESLLPDDKQFSNTIEFYDFCPKYVYWRTERLQDKFLDRIEREFEWRGAKYELSLDPAKIKDSDGIVRDYFPGVVEELVEDALRKLAVDGHGLFLDDQAAVTFTLYELQQELAKTGHTYSLDQIKKALMVCVGTTIHLTTASGETVFSDHLFETVGLNTREDWKGQGKKTKAFVRFNSLVTKSIKEGSWRQFNYEVSMRFKHVVSRQLNKRLSHNFTYANLAKEFNISLSTMIRDFGLTPYKYMRDNLRYVCKSLDEMKEKRVIREYTVRPIFDTERKNKLVDAVIDIKPDLMFVGQIIKANSRQKQVRELTGKTRR